jgi:putative ABC transport system substrate-binding protein
MWPLTTRAQQPAMPLIGFLRSTSLAESMHLVAAFRQGLKEMGLVEGQNVAIEFRSAEDRHDRLPAILAELISRHPAVLVGDIISSLSAKSATAVVPIVFATGADPVRDGLVANLNQPGGNVTGVNFFFAVLGTKRLELLRQVAPKNAPIAVLVNPDSPNTEAERGDVLTATQATGQALIIQDVRSEQDIEPAFATFAQRGATALLVGSGAFLNTYAGRVVALAARHRLPAMYAQREAALAGGLMSYGPSITDAYRQAGIYAGRILKGEKAGDLPVMQATKFSFTINLKTAKALALEVPPMLLALADEVIE